MHSDLNLLHGFSIFTAKNGHTIVIEICLASSRTLLPYRLLGIFQELQTLLCGTLIFHLIYGFLDETQQVINVLRLNKSVLFRAVEEEVRVENLYEQVQIFGLCHADFTSFKRLSQLVHNLLPLLFTWTVEQVRGSVDSLRLQILFKQFSRITDRIRREGVKVVLPEASQRVNCGNDELEGLDFGVSLRDFLLKNDESLRNELVSLIFQLGHITGQQIDRLDGLQVKSKGDFGVVRLQNIYQLSDQLVNLLLVHFYSWSRLLFVILYNRTSILFLLRFFLLLGSIPVEFSKTDLL